MIESKLHELGLHKNEATTYLALIGVGKAKAGELIAATKLHRNLIYTSLESLVQKELVSKTERSGVAVYEANSIQSLVNLVERKKSVAEELVAELKKKQEAAPRDIKVYDGVEGIVQSRERSLSLPAGDTLYVLGGSGLSSTPEFNKYWDVFHRRRVKAKVNAKILFDRTVPPEYVAQRNNLAHTAAKYLPMSVDLPAMFDMFGDTLTISIPGNDPVAFSLRSKEAAEAMKKYFGYLWNQENYVLRGREALQSIWLESIDTGGVKQIGPRGYFVDRYPELMKPILEKMKRTSGATWKFVCEANMQGHELTKFPWTQTKYTLTSSKNLNVIWLWGGKAAVVNWAEDEPIIFVSENPHVVQSYADYFEELWNKK